MHCVAGGYDFAADPDLPATERRVYWSPAIAPGVLTLSAAPPEYGAALTRRQLPLTHLLPDSDGDYAMLGPPGAERQIVLMSSAAEKTGLAVLIPLDADLPGRLEAAASLWRSLAIGDVTTPNTLSPQRRLRLVSALRALDARLDGASVREIARALFGAARVPAGSEWKSHDLRNRTKRLIELGETLMRGGYLDLLRRSGSTS